MKVINIPKLGTVIWDKSLDYPKLLKQIVDLESEIAWLKQIHVEREETIAEKIKIIETKNEYITHLNAINNDLFYENVSQKHLLEKEIIWNRNLSIGIITSATLLLLSKLI